MKSKSKGLVIGAFVVLVSGVTAYAVLNKKGTSKTAEGSEGTLDMTNITINIQALKDQKFDFSNDANTKGDGLAPYDKMLYTLLFSVNNPTSKDLSITSCEIKLTIDGKILAFVPAKENPDGTPIARVPKNSTIQVPYKLGLDLANSIKVINWPANEWYKLYQRLDGQIATGLRKTPTASQDLLFNDTFSKYIKNRNSYYGDYKDSALSQAMLTVTGIDTDNRVTNYGDTAARFANYFKNTIEFGKNVKVELTVRLNKSYDVLASKVLSV